MDLIKKAKRDLARLDTAESAQKLDDMSDALFDLAVAITSLKDWFKNHPAAALAAKDVEQYWQSTALSSFRDIANAGKHCIITQYVPPTTSVLTSVPPHPVAFIDRSAEAAKRSKTYPRLKIIRRDGTRHRALDLGRTAVTECEALMKRHAVV